MTTRFGFDDAGVGFGQAAFASTSADVLIEAGKTLPAFSTSVTLGKRSPLQASLIFPSFSYALPIVSKDRFIDVCEEITIAEPDVHSATVLEWSNTFPTVPTDYVEGGGSSILTLISFNTGSGLSAINIFGSSLISDWENAPNAIQFTANGNTVVIGGPNAPDNQNLDPDAPYSWNMGQADRDELAAWLATYTGGPVTMGFCGGQSLVYRNIIADKDLPTFTAAATVQTRGFAPVRHEIQAAKTFPAAITFTTTVDNRTPTRHAITAAATFNALTATAMVQSRTPTRRVLTASKTFAALTGSATVQVRAPTRHAVAAAATFADFTSTATVQSSDRLRKTLTAAPTFTAVTFTATVPTRVPTRHAITAANTFATFAATTAAVSTQEPRLTLADFVPHAGYSIDALAVWERTESGVVLWNRAGSRFGGSDVLDAGEIGFATANVPITRLRNPSANRVQINTDDDSEIRLADFFAIDSLITFQTIDGAATFPNTELTSSGGRFAWFDTPTALDVLFAALAVGDSLLFAIELLAARHDLPAGLTFPVQTHTVQLEKRAVARRVLEASPTFPAFAATVDVLETEELTAAKTLPSSTTAATVQTRMPTRHAIQAASTFPAWTPTVNLLQTEELTATATFLAFAQAATLAQRNAPRIEVLAAPALPAFAATATLLKRIALTANPTLPALTATANVDQRIADRHALTAAKTFPPLSATADVYQTERVEASATFPAATSTAMVRIQASARIPLTAGLTFPSSTTMATVVAQIPVTAAGTSLAFTSTATVDTRLPVRHAVEASLTFPAVNATATVGKRIPLLGSVTFPAITAAVDVEINRATRHEVQSSAAFPAMSSAVAVYQTELVAASGVLPAFGSTAPVLQRTAARSELQASLALPAFTAALTIGKRIELTPPATTFAAQSVTATVSQRTAARLVLTAAPTFPIFTASVMLGKRIELASAPTFPAVSTTVNVLQDAAMRQDLQAVANLPAFASTTHLNKRIALAAAPTFPALTTTVAVLTNADARKVLEASLTFPAVTTTLTLAQREATQKALEGGQTFVAFAATLTMNTRGVLRDELTAGIAFPALTTALQLDVRAVGAPDELQASATFPAFAKTAAVMQREAGGLIVEAGIHLPQFTATLSLSKGAAMPPSQVTGLTFVESSHTTITIRYDQPDVGTGVFLHYEYRLDAGAWVSTMSAATEYIVTDLMPGTEYELRVRGVSNVGRGPASMPIEGRTQPVTAPTVPLRFRVAVPGGGLVDQSWEVPRDDGGDPVTHYESQVEDPDGDLLPADSTGGLSLRHRVRGLQPYQRYGFRVRAVNGIGPSLWSGTLYATPILGPVTAAVSGFRVPLLDLDRQSLIVRIAGVDTRLFVFWQPSDNAWYASVERPVNTPVVTSRRVATNAGLLDHLPGIAPGNLVCRAVDDNSAFRDPQRDAWERVTHAILWEPT